MTTNERRTARTSATSRRSSARRSTPNSRRPRCRRSTTPSRSISEDKGVHVKLTGEVQQHLGGGRVRCVALGSTDGMVRGMECSTPVRRSRCRSARPRWAACSTCSASRSTAAARSRRGTLAHPPRSAADGRPDRQDRVVRDGHQGHRPADAVRPRRQGRPVRRGRPGQDGHSHRTDRPHRQRARRLLGVRRRRRANPRGERPVAGNAGNQDRQDRPLASSSKRAWSSAR